MSEQEIREGMLLAVWDEPPLDFDPDTLIRRVEQKKSRRRALVAVGVATAMIAVASFSLPGLLPRDQDARLGTETPTNTSAPAVSEPVERKIQLIGDKLTSSLRRQMPSIEAEYATLNPGRIAYPPFSTSTPPKEPGDPEFSGFIHFTDAIGPTALRVTVSREGLNTKAFCSDANPCQDIRQSDGSVVVAAEYFHGSPTIQQAEVARKFESGLVVRIASFAYNPSNGNGQRETVPVRVGQLTQLITDPSISWG